MRLPKIDPIEQHSQLFHGYLARLSFRVRPGEPVALKALLPQAETVAVPVQRLQEPPLVIGEQIQVARKRLLLHVGLRNHRKAVDLLT